MDSNGNPSLMRCLGPHDLPVNGSWLQASDEWKGRVTAYWRELYLNFSRHGDGREKLLYDKTFDEPTGHGCHYNKQLRHSNCSINFANIRERAAALHAAEKSLRSAVTTELCDPANSGCKPVIGMQTAKSDITLWIPNSQCECNNAPSVVFPAIFSCVCFRLELTESYCLQMSQVLPLVTQHAVYRMAHSAISTISPPPAPEEAEACGGTA